MAASPLVLAGASLLLLLGRASTALETVLSCPKGLHQCENRKQMKCFLPEVLCDGERDCADGSDERGCTWCRPGSLLCGGRCARRCDGVVECADERDEFPCPHCRGGAVLCNQRCVPECRYSGENGCVGRCNGVEECSDGGDEARCFRCGWGVEDLWCGRAPPARELGTPRPFRRVTCGRRCDGVTQCDNAWDEQDC